MARREIATLVNIEKRSDIHFGIVSPTFRRSRLVRKLFSDVRAQSHWAWTLTLVHDGPCEKFDRLGRKLKRLDERVLFTHTTCRARDYGATARLTGIECLLRAPFPTDYVLFWDDDNHYFPDALSLIATWLQEQRYPDLLLVPFQIRNRVFPLGKVSQLKLRTVDTANLVMRPQWAAYAYKEVIRQGIRRATDYYALCAVRAVASARVARAGMRPIGIYDGQRTLPRFFYSLGLSQLAYAWWAPRRIAAGVKERLG